MPLGPPKAKLKKVRKVVAIRTFTTMARISSTLATMVQTFTLRYTPAWQEYEQKSRGRSGTEQMKLNQQMMEIFGEFGAIRDTDPASGEAQALVRKLQEFITAHYYACTKQILSGLGQMYEAGGEMTANIDRAGGEGTAAFASRAIREFCA